MTIPPVLELPAGWRDKLVTISAREIRLSDRLLLPAAYPKVVSYLMDCSYLSGPVTWHTDLSDFRSGYGTEGDMTVHFTDKGWATQIQYDLYGIDYQIVQVYRADA